MAKKKGWGAALAPKKNVPKKTAKASVGGDSGEAEKLIARYEEVFGEIGRFIALITATESDMVDATAKVDEAKTVLDKAKEELAAMREFRDGAKHSLYRYLKPTTGEVMPLFDKMAPADEKKHGANSDEWRKEPVAALKLSPVSLASLMDADVMFVGQLQDLVLADPEDWWEEVAGLSFAIAAAIVDRLNDFIFDNTRK